MNHIISAPVNLDTSQQAYLRLKQALTLKLRRQILLVVCDNIELRDRLMLQLTQELADEDCSNLATIPDFYISPLVSLELDLERLNFLALIAQWVKAQPINLTKSQYPDFQIFGIERLNQKSLEVQGRFLKSLKLIDTYIPQLDFNLVLWLPRPWLKMIEESAAEFWRWRTGVFEIPSDPTPSITPQIPTYRSQSVTLPSVSLKQDQAFNYSLLKIPQQQQPLTPIKSDLELKIPSDVLDLDLSYEQESSEVEIASLLDLAYQYRDRITHGDSSEINLMMALQAYDQVLNIMPESDPQIVDILNDMGNLYWMLSRYTNIVDKAFPNLEKAIECYQSALTKISATTNPQNYAMIQNNLGAVYSDLARYQNTEYNLQLAIQAYEDALRYRSRSEDSIKYGSTQNNLGTAYWYLAQRQGSPTYLKAAIKAYEEALAQYEPEQHSLNWAMIQNNIGTAYWNLSQYEDAIPALNIAIQCYLDALKYRTPETSPAACAATQNNLGTAYWHLGLNYAEQPPIWEEYLHRAIASYQIAIDLGQQLKEQQPQIILNFEFWVTLNNLAIVHYQIATSHQSNLNTTHKLSHLEQALHYHLWALQQTTPETENYSNTFEYLVRTMRACYQEGGVAGQNLALGKLPGHLLPEILPRLG